MDVKSIKIDLIHWLTELKDESILEQIMDIKEGHQDWWSEISEEERQAINEGLTQLDRGESVPHKQVMDRIRERFGL